MDCKYIDSCERQVSKEYHSYRCRNHFNQCDTYVKLRRIERHQPRSISFKDRDEQLVRLDDLDLIFIEVKK
jgi:hypothetical protein